MRKAIIIFIISILSITTDIMAQSWNFGIEAGYVNNTLNVNEYKSSKNFVTLHVDRRWSITIFW